MNRGFEINFTVLDFNINFTKCVTASRCIKLPRLWQYSEVVMVAIGCKEVCKNFVNKR